MHFLYAIQFVPGIAEFQTLPVTRKNDFVNARRGTLLFKLSRRWRSTRPRATQLCHPRALPQSNGSGSPAARSF